MNSPQKPRRFEHALNLLEVFRRRSYERQAPNGFEQSHGSHRCLDRDWIRFDEIPIHERQVFFVHLSAAYEIALQASVDEYRPVRRYLVGSACIDALPSEV